MMRQIFFLKFAIYLSICISAGTLHADIQHLEIENANLYIFTTDNKSSNIYKTTLLNKQSTTFKLSESIYPDLRSKQDSILLSENHAFPSAWSIYQDSFQVIFPNLDIDAVGRITFWNFSIELSYLKSEDSNKKQINLYGDLGVKHKHLQFLSSGAFCTTFLREIVLNKNESLNIKKDCIWYDFIVANNKLLILSRLVTNKGIWWIPPNEQIKEYSPNWALNTPENESSQWKIEMPDKFIPIRAMSLPDDFKILTDDKRQIPWQNEDKPLFCVWGTDGKENQLAMFYMDKEQNKCSSKIIAVPQVPAAILYNNDSKHIMLFYKNYFDNVPEFTKGMTDIIDFLNKEKLLKKYQSQCSNIQSKLMNENTRLFEYGDKKLVVSAKYTESPLTKREYCSSINAILEEDNKNRVIWEKNFSDPGLSGTGEGLLNDLKTYQLLNKDILVIISMYHYSNSTILKFIKIETSNKFQIKEYEFIDYREGSFEKISLIQELNSLLYIKGIRHGKDNEKFEYIYDIGANLLLNFVSPTQFFYPYCPWELAVYYKYNNISTPEKPLELSCNDFKAFAENANIFNTGDDIANTFILRFNTFLAFYEAQYFSNILGKGLNDISLLEEIEKIPHNINIPDFQLQESLDTYLKNADTDKKQKLTLLYCVNKKIESIHTHSDEIAVTPDEIEKFYQNYTWVFFKDNQKELYPLDTRAKNFISSEIKRLKYYQLNELLINPPELKINWNKLPPHKR